MLNNWRTFLLYYVVGMSSKGWRHTCFVPILTSYYLFWPFGTSYLHIEGNRKYKITLTPPTKVLTIPNTIKPKVFGFIDRNYFSMSRCYCLHQNTVEYLILIHNSLCSDKILCTLSELVFPIFVTQLPPERPPRRFCGVGIL